MDIDPRSLGDGAAGPGLLPDCCHQVPLPGFAAAESQTFPCVTLDLWAVEQHQEQPRDRVCGRAEGQEDVGGTMGQPGGRCLPRTPPHQGTAEQIETNPKELE